MNKVSVFGSTGFIGSAFTKFSSCAIDPVSKENPDPIYSEILYAIGTTDNYNIFENPLLDIETNLMRLIADLEILRKKYNVFTFNYLSSWFVYGDAQLPPFQEDQPCMPRGFYSITKYSAELLIKSYCETYGIKYRIFRLANVFGIGDLGISKKKNALQYLISEMKKGNEINLYDEGNFVRDYIDVRDVVRALDLMIVNSNLNEIYNIGTGVGTNFRELIFRSKEIIGSKSQIGSIATPDFHKIVQVKNSYLNVSKLVSHGFVPKYNIFEEIVSL